MEKKQKQEKEDETAEGVERRNRRGGGAGRGGDRNSSRNVGAAFLGALATAFDINLACVGVAVGVTRLDLGGLGES